MRKLQRSLMAALLALAVGLAGCGARREPERAPEKKEQGKEKQGKEKKEEDPVASGAERMKEELSALRDSLGTGDTAEVREQARRLDDSWEKFEAKVEAKNPRMYDQVESSLNIILAGVQVVPTDNRLISAEVDKLDTTLDELKEKKGKQEKPKKVEMQTGAAAMRHQLAELKSAAASGDTAKMQEAAKAADRSWTQFEDEVREQDEEKYTAIEDSLHTILAEVKASPPDQQKLTQEVEKLDGQLKGLTKS